MKVRLRADFSGHAFECLDCLHEWRMEPTNLGWPLGACPSCGGLYWDWLSWEVRPQDAYLDVEWRSGLRRYEGSFKVTRRS